MTVKFINGKIIDGQIQTGKNLYVENGMITAVTEDDLPCDQVIDAGGPI